ncbi:acid phosphatase type 7 isoform X1 [Drosophila takahashii]|uniref:acid phosphatase type 7 isoform X1 n=1 Tax=Drosophila takahashii TaxID=29030 RepID=UPI001CF86874|nr:acid phosphatase type 7 isoform X1 [Drosophila takahashii]
MQRLHFPLLASLLLLPGILGLSQVSAEEEVNIVHYQPEQVHLAFGEHTDSEIVVTWSTRSLPPDQEVGAPSVVEYGQLVAGQARLTQQASGSATKFVDGGHKQATQFIHRVTLRDLEPNATYAYHCGSALGWSAIFQFRTVPSESSDWSPSLAIYGDMGNENAQSLARLQEETQRGMYDAIIHVGDFAYDMNSHNARVGDEFMRQIETVAAYLPYMVVPGNHEEKFNFSNYRARFSMPGGTENLFYSFDLGPVHFVAISTEVYYFLNYGLKPLVFQFDWLREDLAKANLPANRAKRPWIIIYGHRPMYCSNENDNDCTHSETLTRVGWPFVHMFGLEPLLYEFGVDVAIWAHEHSYERLWPIYDYEVRNGTLKKDSPYEDPRAPVHIVTGSAGCKEGREPFKGKIPEWSAFHSQDYGYTRLKAHNRTHLHFEQVSDDQNGAIIDEFWLVKSKHGSYQN